MLIILRVVAGLGSLAVASDVVLLSTIQIYWDLLEEVGD